MDDNGESDVISSCVHTLDSISTTTLVFPGMCRTSVVNSATNERWRVCLGDLSALMLNANLRSGGRPVFSF